MGESVAPVRNRRGRAQSRRLRLMQIVARGPSARKRALIFAPQVYRANVAAFSKGANRQHRFSQQEQRAAHASTSACIHTHLRRVWREPALPIPVPCGLSPIGDRTRAPAPQRWPIRNSTSHRATTAAISSDTAEVCCLRGSLMLRSFSSSKALPAVGISTGARCARRSNVACVPRNPDPDDARAAVWLRLRRGPGRRRTGRRFRNKAMDGALLGGRREHSKLRAAA
jgi:hypothetical protein